MAVAVVHTRALSGVAAPQVSGVSCLSRNIVGEPTTRPPPGVFTPSALPRTAAQ